MEIKFNFKSFEPSDHLKSYAQTRFEKLEKYIKKSDNAQLLVNMEVEKFRQIAEVILSSDDMRVSAQKESEDMYSTIDMVLDKIETQVKKLKDKQKDKRKGKSSKAEELGPESVPGDLGSPPDVVKTDMFEPKPMDVDEAVRQLQKSDYDFLVFFNAETSRVNVIYRRKNGDFGLIDPGM